MADAEWEVDAPKPTRFETDPWEIDPVAHPELAPKTSTPEAVARAYGQGATLGLADEVNGGIQAIGDKLSGTPGTWSQLYKHNRDSFRRDDAKAKEDHPGAYLAAETVGSLPTSFLPGLNIGKGATLLKTLARSGAVGGISGLGASTAETPDGIAGDTVAGVGIGMGAGAAGRVLGRFGGAASQKVAAIDEGVARKSAELAAQETASARSAAGNAAQDAYRQLEHLREIGQTRVLSTEEQQVARALTDELAAKAQEKLLPAAARKASTAATYADALSTESQRANDLAAQKLSGGEALNQLKARALRYGLPAVGGALAGAAGFGGHGALVGAGSGALMGAGLRPMMHSLVRMASQPAVSRPAMTGLAATLEGLGRAAPHAAGPASITEGAYAAALINALRKKQEPDYSTWTLDNGATP